ncbi:MAG: hypothetical protein J0L62_14985 [Bacteroidetes bacterium]|nr:hypothetical protein [Bacteroidota bacterium]
MKNPALYLVPLFITASVLPIQLKAETVTTPVISEATVPSEKTEMTVLMDRLEAIKAMDATMMNAEDKKALRTEVVTINEQLKNQADGVYLSVGAIIIIVLLLIVLF